MKLEDIYKFFENPPPIYLRQEVAVCYLLHALLQGDSYGGELIEQLEIQYPRYRMSETVFYSAMNFLEAQQAVIGYWQNNDGRGRPRRMYQICPHWQAEAEKLALLWQRYIEKNCSKDR